ncbi:MAG: DUF1963 domain-containing protein [Candidatus Sericytochromatia bacterium]
MKVLWTLAVVASLQFGASATGIEAQPLLVVTSLTDPTLRELVPATMTDRELVANYELVALVVSEFYLAGRVETYNHHVALDDAFYVELSRRGPAAQRLILPLLDHAVPNVAAIAARHALEFAPELAEARLEALAKLPTKGSRWTYPPDKLLERWRMGELKPASWQWEPRYVSPEVQRERLAQAKVVPTDVPRRSLTDVDQLMDDHGFTRFKSSLKKGIRPAISLRPRPADDSVIPVGVSKLGGSPDLPPAAMWPKRQGRAMAFLAQVRLGDVKRHDWRGQLPPTGTLSFFYDADAGPGLYSEEDPDGAGAVLFTPADADIRRRGRPATLLPDLIYPASMLYPAGRWMLAPGAIGGDGRGDEAHWRKAWDFEQALGADASGTHHMLGWADAQQDDMEPLLAYKNPTRPRDWRLLLQLGSDEAAAGWMWGDAGAVYFWITEQDLKARRFDRVKVLAQCG